jgi:hypothetical protein
MNKENYRWVVTICHWQLQRKFNHIQFSFPLKNFTSVTYIYQVWIAILLLQVPKLEWEEKNVSAVWVLSVSKLLHVIRTAVSTEKYIWCMNCLYNDIIVETLQNINPQDFFCLKNIHRVPEGLLKRRCKTVDISDIPPLAKVTQVSIYRTFILQTLNSY